MNVRQTLVLTPDEMLEFEADCSRFVALPSGCALQVVKKSLDARHRKVRFLVQVEVVEGAGGAAAAGPVVTGKPLCGEVVVVGAGPAGLFAALALLELGVRPVVLDRGAGFPQRHLAVRDLRLWGRMVSAGPLTSGLGGAGTYSDGKLHTRRKGGSVPRALELFAYFARDGSLLYEAHPHIGSNRLPAVVERIREFIVESGGQVRFGASVAKLKIKGKAVRGVELDSGACIEGDAVVLACGNSARGLFSSCHGSGVSMEAKAFAVGVRVEHPRCFVDSAQLGQYAGHEACGAARYSLAFQVGGRGVYTFCMCPGGYVIPTPPESGHLAVNGMSFSTRSSRWSNAALVVTVGPADFGSSVLDGVAFQRSIESACFEAGEGYFAPAQRAVDLVKGDSGARLPESSYRPGVRKASLARVLPGFVLDGLKGGLLAADRKMAGYLSPEALVLGPETLTSSPVRFLRDENGQSLSHTGLFPCGEGSGWAGGITSSAADGLECGAQVARAVSSGL